MPHLRGDENESDEEIGNGQVKDYDWDTGLSTPWCHQGEKDGHVAHGRQDEKDQHGHHGGQNALNIVALAAVISQVEQGTVVGATEIIVLGCHIHDRHVSHCHLKHFWTHQSAKNLLLLLKER